MYRIPILINLLFICLLLFFWQIICTCFHFPRFLLPSPWDIYNCFVEQGRLIFINTVVTFVEVFISFIASIFIGVGIALVMVLFNPLRILLWPILLLSQTLPVFAIAPILVLWLGYGVLVKIFAVTLMLFFPIASNFYDGLRHTPLNFLALGKIMGAKRGQILWRIQVPHALPALGSGLRITAILAPMGAILGEWIGSSHGLGFLMLEANAQLETSLLFSSILMLTVIAVVLYLFVHKVIALLTPWLSKNF